MSFWICFRDNKTSDNRINDRFKLNSFSRGKREKREEIVNPWWSSFQSLCDMVLYHLRLMRNMFQALRKDNLSINTSPLIDTPSKFLDPNTNFIPRFDLRDAYAVVDAMHSCRTSSLSTEGVNWVCLFVHTKTAKQCPATNLDSSGQMFRIEVWQGERLVREREGGGGRRKKALLFFHFSCTPC